MINAEIFEPDKHCPYRVIYYRDHNDQVIRHVWVDNDNRIVRDYLYEKRKDGQYNCVVVFGSDHISSIGVKEYIYDHLDRRNEVTQYELRDGKKIQIQKDKFFYEGETNRCYKVVVYGRTEEPVGYTLYTYDEAGIAPAGSYNMNNERIQKFNVERLF